MKYHYAAMTHVGGRAHNEDAYCVEPALGLFAVADGMGGYEGGEVASRVAVQALAAALGQQPAARAVGEGAGPCVPGGPTTPVEQVTGAVVAAHAAVVAQRRGVLAEMGSTLAVLVVRGSQAVIAHVGDSRVYRLRDGALEALTRDHSLVEEMRAAGWTTASSEELARGHLAHIVTRAVGLQGGAQPDVAVAPVRPGDAFLLCSDGLHGALSPALIAWALGADTPGDACARLIDAALTHETSDNVTVVVVRAVA